MPGSAIVSSVNKSGSSANNLSSKRQNLERVQTEEVAKIVRDSSKSRLESFLNVKDLHLEDVDRSELIYQPWMVLILMSGPLMRVTLKVHFKIEDAKILVSSLYGSKASEIKTEQGLDFVREVCNLVAGSVKMGLAERGVNVELSLPVSTRGWEEYFFGSEDTAGHVDWWKISSSQASLNFSSCTERFGSI